jgi:ERCC4-type nuclease
LTLHIDDREDARIICKARELESDIQVSRLTVADYAFGEYGFEHKNYNDLLGSIYDTRYWTQLGLLKDTYPKPVIIFEGNIQNSYKKMRENGELRSYPLSESDRKIIRSTENGTFMGWNIPILYTVDQEDTATRVVELYKRYTGEDKGAPPRVAVRKGKTPEEIRKLMLMNIEGIGSKTSERILEKYTFLDLLAYGDPNVLVKNVQGLKFSSAEMLLRVMN